MSVSMDFRERIRKLLAERNLTEWQLADQLGMHRGAIVQMLANERRPAPLECLLLAGYLGDNPEREYWLHMSRVTDGQKRLIASAVGGPPLDLSSLSPEVGHDIATFLNFIAHAHPERRKAVQAVLEAWRTEHE
jgi:transcriptional regulator with XRE-family HTH domain